MVEPMTMMVGLDHGNRFLVSSDVAELLSVPLCSTQARHCSICLARHCRELVHLMCAMTVQPIKERGRLQELGIMDPKLVRVAFASITWPLNCEWGWESQIGRITYAQIEITPSDAELAG